MIGVTSPDGARETYTYSADGLRQKKASAAGSVIYVRDDENVLLETDANLLTQLRYTDFPGVWGGLTSQRRGGVSSFYGFDQQENTRLVVSVAGLITDSYTYKGFGEELASSGSTPNPFRYGGQVGYYRDALERLYVRARYLDTGRGRWFSRDPLKFQAGVIYATDLQTGRGSGALGLALNSYGYSLNQPTNLVDPSGLWAVGPVLCGAACATAIGYLGLSFLGCLSGGANICNALQCMLDTFNSLDPVRQTAIAAGFISCLVCVGAAAGGAIGRLPSLPLPTAVCLAGATAALISAVSTACAKTGRPPTLDELICPIVLGCYLPPSIPTSPELCDKFYRPCPPETVA
ncbi:MAG: RHS repeat-associated core domain-containing protein [Thermoproteota archaeon]|nr:RHS repeat-associated core domain-containing protein [Thermoproteota archaeon]